MAEIPDVASQQLIPPAIDVNTVPSAIARASATISNVANDLRASLDKLIIQCNGSVDCVVKAGADAIRQAVDAAKAAIEGVTGPLDDSVCGQLAFIKTIADYAKIPSFDTAGVCKPAPLTLPPVPVAPTSTLTLPPTVIVPGTVPFPVIPSAGTEPFSLPPGVFPGIAPRVPGPLPISPPASPPVIVPAPSGFPSPGGTVPPPPGTIGSVPGGAPFPVSPPSPPLPPGIAPVPPGAIPPSPGGIFPVPSPGSAPGPFPGVLPPSPPSALPPGGAPLPPGGAPPSLPPSPPSAPPAAPPSALPPSSAPSAQAVAVDVVNFPEQPYGGDLGWLEKSEGRPDEARMASFWGSLWNELTEPATIEDVLKKWVLSEW
jgi:hypothetical protein